MRLIVTLASSVVLALGGAGVAAAATGTVTGHVTDASGHPLAGIGVMADPGGFAGGDDDLPSATTGADGAYRLTGLPTGSYIIGFVGDLDGHLGEYYAARPVGDGVTHVVVSDGATVSGIDAALRTGATVSGHVLGADGRPLKNASVLVDAAPGFGFPEQALTDSAGSYVVRGVWPGPNTVRVRPPAGSGLVGQYAGGTETVVGARVVPVGDGAAMDGGDVRLAAGRMIRGRVTDADGSPLASVRVSAARPGASFARLTDTYTAADGTYALGALAPGEYVVAFQPSDNHVAAYSGGAATIRDAAAVAVGGAVDTTGVDAALAPGAVLKGHVTDEAGGAALRWAEVTATPSVPDELLDFFATRDADDGGNYVIQGLRPGTYSLRFASPFDRNMATEDGPTVTLAAGETKVVDDDLHALTGASPEPGHAAGTVVGPDGAPLAGARVTPVTATNYERDSVLTDASGHFVTADLAAGTYLLRAAAAGLQTTYFPASPSLGGGGQPVTVAAGATTDGNTITLSAAAAPGDGQDDPPGGDPTGGDPTGGGSTGGDPAAGGDTPGGDSTGGDTPGGDPADGGSAGGDPLGDDATGGGASPAPASPFALAAPAPTLAASFPIATRNVLAPPPSTTGRARVLSGRLVPRAGSIAVRLSCPGAVTCRGTLRVVESAHHVTVASGAFTVRAGRRATARPRLTARGRALKSKRHLAVSVVLPGARAARATLVG
jgi:hypothetical protein